MSDMKMVNGVEVPLTPEEQADHDARIAAWEADAGNRVIRSQIQELENTIPFTRKMRESILNIDALKALDEKITALRAKLT